MSGRDYFTRSELTASLSCLSISWSIFLVLCSRLGGVEFTVGGVSMADVDTAGELDGFEPSASSASEQPEEGWCQFFSIVASLLRECDRNTSTSDLSKMESICERLERSLCDI